MGAFNADISGGCGDQTPDSLTWMSPSGRKESSPMTLTDLANAAEVLAGFGVIASLIYVGYQVKETRKAVRAATAQARTDLGVQLISAK